jgi:hypothetical protein
MQFMDETTRRIIDEAPSLEAKIGAIMRLAVGAGSRCWAGPSGTGVFQEDVANEISDQAAEAIQAEVTKVLGWVSAPRGEFAPKGERLID